MAAKELERRGYKVHFSKGNFPFAKNIHVEWGPITGIAEAPVDRSL